MILASIRVITDDIKGLAAFYERVTGVEPQWLTDAFAAFRTEAGALALADVGSLTYGGTPGIAEPASNRSAFIEFRVDDVDAEYARLTGEGIVESFELEPTTMPWGNRSILFRDPDGNLVNFFAPLTDEAKARNAR